MGSGKNKGFKPSKFERKQIARMTKAKQRQLRKQLGELGDIIEEMRTDIKEGREELEQGIHDAQGTE